MAALVSEGAKAAGTTSFRFVDLPYEMQYAVLEHTELVSPERHIFWEATRKFYLRLANNPWRVPLSLLLVSKSVYAMAREIYWSHNHFEVRADYTRIMYALGLAAPGDYGQPLTLPKRLPACEFLEDVVPTECLRYLRSLDLQNFDLSEMLYHHAVDEWAQTLDYIKINGGLRLDFLKITGCSSRDLREIVWEGTSHEQGMDLIRPFVKEHLWPFHIQDTAPPFTKQVLIDLTNRRPRIRYSIRQQNYEIPERYLASCAKPCPQPGHDFALPDGEVKGKNSLKRPDGDGSKCIEEIWIELEHQDVAMF
ncbi:hypothetical protein HJFPF1_11110 [Paramyrothecium foliicola]|nr:hypothetical protein HJFPF1_11110 [Paramyrothecium foliicola]